MGDRIDEAVEVGLAAYNAGNASDLGGLIENVILAAMPVLLGPVVEKWRRRVGGDQYASVDDAILDCIDEAEAVYAPSLGEGDGR